MPAWTLLALYPAAHLVAHAALSRLRRGRMSNQMIALAALGLSLAALGAADIGAQLRGGRVDPARTVYLLVCAGCAGYSYSHFFNMSETSRRIKLLRMLSGIGREDAAKADYDLDDILQVRLARLEAMGQIRREGDRYVLTGRTLYRAYAVLEGLKKVLALDAPRR